MYRIMIADCHVIGPDSYLVLPGLPLKAARMLMDTVEAEDMACKFVPWRAKLYPALTILMAGMTWLDYGCIDCMDDLN